MSDRYVFGLIANELHRQDVKWGEQNHSDLKWLAILSEEIGEVAKAILEKDTDNIDVEIIQSAAVLCQWYLARQRRAEQGD
jgi:NTP pyrophosphatase (non-canonical NTP hydrolase)